METAMDLSVGSSYSGSIDWPGDWDFFRLQINSSGTLSAYTTGSTDVYGYLFDSSGNTLTSDDDSGEGYNFSFSYSVGPGTYYIKIRHYSDGYGTGDYTLYTSMSGGGGGGGGAGDPGGSMGSASSLGLGSSTSQSIDYAGDEDYFQVYVSSYGTITSYTSGSTDVYGYLLDSSGNTLTYNDDNPYPNFSFGYSVSPGTYYIRVRHYSSGGTGSYTLYTSFSGGGGGGGGSTVSLGDALDNTSLNWTTGGYSSWFGQTGSYYSGGDAAQGGGIGPNQYCYLETTVTGPGALTFYWSVSSEYWSDFLRFSIDSVEQTSLTGSVGWTYQSYNLSSGQHTLRWNYTTDASGQSGSNAGWVDGVQFAPSVAAASVPSSNPDIVWRHTANGLNAVWFMSSSSLQQSSPILPDIVPDLDWNVVGTGDFNQDGQKDLVWQHRTTGYIGVWFMNGRAMTSTAMTNPSQVNDLGWRIVSVADFNSDGKPDLLFQHDSTLQVALWYMDGVNQVSATLTNPSTPNDNGWRVVGAGDMDRNGTTDIIWRHIYYDYVAIWYMNGTSFAAYSYTYPYSSPNDLNWDIVDTGDFNGDQTLDFLWQHRLTGQLNLWHMNSANVTWITGTSPGWPDSVYWKAQAVGQIRDDPVDSDYDLMPDAWEQQHFGGLSRNGTSDFDGDGISDLAEYRNGTNPTQISLGIKISRPRNWANIP